MIELEETIDHLEKWLDRCRKANAAAPYVQRTLETLRWEAEVFNDRPDIADEIPLGDLSATFGRQHQHLTEALPMMPEYDASKVSMGTAVATSASATTYTYITRVGSLPNQEARDYATQHTSAYRQLQDSHDRPQEVRALLQKLGNPQTLDRFDRALRGVLTAKHGIKERTAAANEMRNLLDGVKGDLFQKARRRPRENMDWDIMTQKLTSVQIGSVAHQELREQKSRRGSLYNQLSSVLKDREGHARIDLDDLWSQVLDHLYVVLTLIDIEDAEVT
jgi:hypothetical protein